MTEAAAGMPMEDLIDQEVGQATGTLAGWSAQADDSMTMACNFKGIVYTVKGYDENFRLIIHDAESVGMPWIVMDNYDDIELRCGLDLFETRLHLVSRIKSAEAEGRDGKKRKVSAAKASKLLRAACAAQMEPATWQDQFLRSRRGKTGWLNLELKDGTRVQLYLEEGGYVTYAPLSNFCVAIPGNAFDQVFRSVSDVKHYD